MQIMQMLLFGTNTNMNSNMNILDEYNEVLTTFYP